MISKINIHKNNGNILICKNYKKLIFPKLIDPSIYKNNLNLGKLEKKFFSKFYTTKSSILFSNQAMIENMTLKTTTTKTTTTTTKSEEIIEDSTNEDSLEIKDPIIIFNNVWKKLEDKYGLENLKFPKEIIWLMGAPGSGKSFNAPWIRKARAISAKELVMSSLLTSPESEKIKREGGLVGDSFVLEILLEQLLKPQYSNGVVVDGFPRTKVQVECIKMLKEKMLKLRQQFINDPNIGSYFPRPVFRVVVLFVDEKESVERQLKRGRETREHNQKVLDTGIGQLKEERLTDFNEEAARRRYAVFKKHYSTLKELSKHFKFHVINTKGSIREIREHIMKEFMWQSSLELSQETHDLMIKIPVVNDLISNARQNLVKRLDNYQTKNSKLFSQVIDLIQKEFIPIIEQNCISGKAQIRTINQIFDSDQAKSMVLDVLSERGYYVTVHQVTEQVPIKVDLKTGEIKCESNIQYVFSVKFKRSIIRQEPPT